jgi:hypothetical protein
MDSLQYIASDYGMVGQRCFKASVKYYLLINYATKTRECVWRTEIKMFHKITYTYRGTC